MILKDAQDWIDKQHAAGAKQIGVTCNPMQHKLFLTADDKQLVIECPVTRKEVRIIKDILHDHIGRLPGRKPNGQA